MLYHARQYGGYARIALFLQEVPIGFEKPHGTAGTRSGCLHWQ